jgi:hypothetical protein
MLLILRLRIILAFNTSKGFELYQMNVKNVFLMGVIQEEVFVRQPPGFENPKYPHRVCNLSKALYRFKQASQAWYARFKTFLLQHGYVMGTVDKSFFTLKYGNDFLLVQIYVDDIFSVSLLTLLCQVFRKCWRKSSRCQ